MTEFKIGDKVRVVRHRNYFNEELPDYENIMGRVTTVSEWHDINDDGEAGPWRAFTSTDVHNTWMRTDDVELVEQGPVRHRELLIEIKRRLQEHLPYDLDARICEAINDSH